MADNKYAIVHFPSDNSVEIVCQGWISEDSKTCRYPKSGAKSKAKKNKPSSEDWDLYEIRVLKYFGKKLFIVIKYYCYISH